MLFPFWPAFLSSLSFPFPLICCIIFQRMFLSLSLCSLDLDIRPSPPQFCFHGHILCFYFYPLSFSRLFTILLALLFFIILYVPLCGSYKIAIKPGNIAKAPLRQIEPPWLLLLGYSVKVKVKVKLHKTRHHRLISGIDRELSTACTVDWPMTLK